MGLLTQQIARYIEVIFEHYVKKTYQIPGYKTPEQQERNEEERKRKELERKKREVPSSMTCSAVLYPSNYFSA